MAHKVKVTMVVPEMSKVDTSFEISHHGKKLGTLKVSKGAIEYYPKGHSIPIKKTWTQLNDLLIKSVVILISALILTSCAKDRQYSYADYANSLPEDLKLSKRKLAELEALPGYEEEKKATRTNIAIGEKACLRILLDNYHIKYGTEHGKSATAEQEAEFKRQVRYDSIEAALNYIIEVNKLE
jgi:hypothetical protein